MLLLKAYVPGSMCPGFRLSPLHLSPGCELRSFRFGSPVAFSGARREQLVPGLGGRAPGGRRRPRREQPGRGRPALLPPPFSRPHSRPQLGAARAGARGHRHLMLPLGVLEEITLGEPEPAPNDTVLSGQRREARCSVRLVPVAARSACPAQRPGAEGPLGFPRCGLRPPAGPRGFFDLRAFYFLP